MTEAPDRDTHPDWSRLGSAGEGEPPVVELVVHGVHGTSAQAMLEDPRIVQMQGDEVSGVYRRTDDFDAELRPGDSNPGTILEAYAWQPQAVGGLSRGLWLLLLPFLLVNLAHWMWPQTAAGGAGRTRRLYGLLLRLLGLSLTVQLVWAAAEIPMDLIAWQCAANRECSAAHSWLSFLGPASGSWWGQPGRALALTALVPLALLWLLARIGRRVWERYESMRPPLHQPGSDEETACAGSPLGRPGFWYSRRLGARLRSVHLTAGMITVAALILIPVSRYDAARGDTALRLIDQMLASVLVTVAAMGIWVVCRRGRTEERLDQQLDHTIQKMLPYAAGFALVSVVVTACWSRPQWQASGALLGPRDFSSAIMLVQFVLLSTAAITAHVAARTVPEPALAGLTGPATAGLACWLASVMTASPLLFVADRLDAGATHGGRDSLLHGPPAIESFVLLSLLPALVFVLVAAVFVRTRIEHMQRLLVPLVEMDYGIRHEFSDPVRTRSIARAKASAAATDLLSPLLVCSAAGALLVMSAAAIGAWGGAAPLAHLAQQDASTVLLRLFGQWLVPLAFLVLPVLGAFAYRLPLARRTVGLLWDIGTFWPRAAHPFAPPCYAERAVPDLNWHLSSWAERSNGPVLLRGHGQGSVLAVAAVWQLPTTTRHKVALLTTGSPLERVYGRLFPLYFGPRRLREIQADVRIWRNLWRQTDPIGGPVRVFEKNGPATDVGPLLDPLSHGRTLHHPLYSPIRGHSGYTADPVHAQERATLLEQMRPWHG